MLDNQDNYNVAAMYEALELLNVLFDSCVLGTHSEMTADEMDKVDELYFKTKAALSKPPRNCDRFCSIEQAKAAYCEEVRNVFIWDGDESERFEKWLLAPAKHKGEK